MGVFNTIIHNLPEEIGPTQKRLPFKEKLKWTGIVLILFFILGLIPLFGLGQNALQNFEFLSIILAAKFGSIISLGIGPLVTASIVLQLLNGSGISLFIAAGVSEEIMVKALSWLPSPSNPGIATGAIPALFQSLAAGDPTTAFLMLSGVLATILVFVISIYAQSMKVEIPLSFGRIRGHGIRWPLSFLYTS